MKKNNKDDSFGLASELEHTRKVRRILITFVILLFAGLAIVGYLLFTKIDLVNKVKDFFITTTTTKATTTTTTITKPIVYYHIEDVNTYFNEEINKISILDGYEETTIDNIEDVTTNIKYMIFPSNQIDSVYQSFKMSTSELNTNLIASNEDRTTFVKNYVVTLYNNLNSIDSNITFIKTDFVNNFNKNYTKLEENTVEHTLIGKISYKLINQYGKLIFNKFSEIKEDVDHYSIAVNQNINRELKVFKKYTKGNDGYYIFGIYNSIPFNNDNSISETDYLGIINSNYLNFNLFYITYTNSNNHTYLTGLYRLK